MFAAGIAKIPIFVVLMLAGAGFALGVMRRSGRGR
jgi:hypothetical protein